MRRVDPRRSRRNARPTVRGRSAPGRGGRRRGIALILTLLVLAVLVVLVVQFAFSVRIEERIVRNTQDDAALELAARGAGPLMAGLFRDDRKNGAPEGAVDTLADVWCDPNAEDARTFTVGDVELKLEVEDLERRLPLLWLADSDEAKRTAAERALARVIQHLAPAPVEPQDVATTIAERVRELVGDGEDALGTARARFYSVEQLRVEDSFPREVLYGDAEADPPTEGIAPYVTTWPVERLNLNTVFEPVLIGFMPEQDHDPEGAQPISFEEAVEIVQAVRERRIDPEVAGGGEDAEGDKGASRTWPGEPFTEAGELQSAEIHPRLEFIFPQAQGGGGEGGGGEGGGGEGGGGEGGGGEGGGGEGGGQQAGPQLDLKGILSVESRFYMVKVTATLQASDEEGFGAGPAPADDEEGAERPQSVYRMLVYRSSGDEVATLFVRESPQ